MYTKAQWLKKSLEFFKHIQKETRPYTLKVLGRPLVVFPNVFSPKYANESAVFAQTLPKLVRNKNFLEIGTGTGVVALHVALGGAAKVVATDINKDAALNAKANFKIYGLKASVRKGNLFEPIRKNEKFDVIFWNHPFNKAPYKPKDILLRAGLDYNYNDLRKYFINAKRHLTKEGVVLLGTGSIAYIRDIKHIARAAGYSCKLLQRKRVSFEAGSRIGIESYIYSFSPMLK